MTAPAVPAARTSRAREVRRQKTEAGLARIKDVLDQMIKSRVPITMAAVARTADVSRTFLYEHAEARGLVHKAMSQAAGRRVQDRQAAQAELEASWRERALNTEAALKTAHAEILAQREQIADLLGQVRDLRNEWSQEDVARIITDNGNLKRRVREAGLAHRLVDQATSLGVLVEERARNIRFADKRIADLEVQLCEQRSPNRP
jgi:cell division protein FtsL